mmetsp:Transcript_2136/g.4833  ORF Transcript_2136/g.4833 Transcript_2136/m.4833 type:complete len:248 (-) Transcript_2136:1255-1998(-)
MPPTGDAPMPLSSSKSSSISVPSAGGSRTPSRVAAALSDASAAATAAMDPLEVRRSSALPTGEPSARTSAQICANSWSASSERSSGPNSRGIWTCLRLWSPLLCRTRLLRRRRSVPWLLRWTSTLELGRRAFATAGAFGPGLIALHAARTKLPLCLPPAPRIMEASRLFLMSSSTLSSMPAVACSGNRILATDACALLWLVRDLALRCGVCLCGGAALSCATFEPLLGFLVLCCGASCTLPCCWQRW